MQRKAWNSISAIGVGLIVLGLAARTHAGEDIFCCVCDCGTLVTCTMDIDPADCRMFCSESGTPGSACRAEVSSSPCSALAECHQGVGTPALGVRGLMTVALVLASAGALGVRRAARRKPG